MAPQYIVHIGKTREEALQRFEGLLRCARGRLQRGRREWLTGLRRLGITQEKGGEEPQMAKGSQVVPGRGKRPSDPWISPLWGEESQNCSGMFGEHNSVPGVPLVPAHEHPR